MASRKEIVERELGVTVPEQYEHFLNRYGIYQDFGVEVYGIHERLLRWDGIPCVIGATKLARKTDHLPHHFLLIHETGYEGELVLLDARDGLVYSLVYGRLEKLADSFDEWFEKEILSRPGTVSEDDEGFVDLPPLFEGIGTSADEMWVEAIERLKKAGRTTGMTTESLLEALVEVCLETGEIEKAREAEEYLKKLRLEGGSPVRLQSEISRKSQ